MNCYLCRIETGHLPCPALGICHTCGCGICEQHLVLLIARPVSGMATLAVPRRQLLCVHCYETISGRCPTPAPQKPQRQHKPSSSRWWKWFKPRETGALPEPEEAIVLVERYLKEQHLPQEEHDG